MTGRGRRAVACGVGLVVALAAVTGGQRVAAALFASTASATVEMTVEAPVIPRPASVSCQTAGTPLVAQWAAFSWTHPDGAPQPTEYVIRVLDGGNDVEVVRVPGSTTSFDLTTGVLGAVGSLLDIILGGQTRPVTVNAVYQDFESPSEYTHHLRPEIGVLSGIGCGPGATP